MDFWERYEELLKATKTTQEWLAGRLGTDSGAISRWKKREIFPDAMQAVVIARALNTTVEELVEGDPGAAYVRDLVAASGVGWHPSEKLKPLVDDLEILDDTRFASAKDMVHGLAELARTDRVAQSKHDGQAGTAG